MQKEKTIENSQKVKILISSKDFTYNEKDLSEIIGSANHGENLQELIQQIGNEFQSEAQTAPANALQNNVKAMTIEPEEFIINENLGLSELKLNETTLVEAVILMNKFSENRIVNNNVNQFNKLLLYRDNDIALCFNHKNILTEITLGKGFKGKTSKNIKIGDTLAKTQAVYGEPGSRIKDKSIEFCSWDNLTIFFKEDIITHIRLKSKNT